MRLFGLFAQRPPEQEPPKEPTVWEDKFGRLTTRCIQTLALLALVSVGPFLIVQLRLVLVPVIVSLILASGFNPIMRRFRADGVPMALAAATVLVPLRGMV